MADISIITTHWNQYLNFFDKYRSDIYFTEEYVKLYENGNDKAECFVYSESDQYFIFPYLKRKIESSTGEYYDFETAYGYGGPIANNSKSGFLENAYKNLYDALHENAFIAGFIRFHPIFNNFITASEFCDPRPDRKTVSIDLLQPEANIWNGIHSKHRNVIRKAESHGLKFRIDERMDNIETFIKIYHGTMDRLAAPKFYMFSKEYFLNLKNKLPGLAFIAEVMLEDRVISSALFLKYGIYAHYHLAGSIEECKKYYPNNFLLYMAALHLKKNCYERLHLGGGSDNDTENKLYKFKKRFSRSEHDFYIGKIVVNSELYSKICDDWEALFPEKKEKYAKLILKYRY